MKNLTSGLSQMEVNGTADFFFAVAAGVPACRPRASAGTEACRYTEPYAARRKNQPWGNGDVAPSPRESRHPRRGRRGAIFRSRGLMLMAARFRAGATLSFLLSQP